jgi:putative MATE family efflux protein
MRSNGLNPRANNLTSGSILKGLLGLTGPMLASAVLQNLQSVIDLFWVGKLGSESIAGVAIGGVVLTMLFPLIMGTSLGTVALVSRSVGSGRYDEASAITGNSLVLSIMTGAVMGVIGWIFTEPLCRMLGASPGIVEKGTEFLHIMFLGSFTVFLLFTANSAIQGAGNAVTPMVVMVLANVLNIILAPIFIFGLLGMPRMEVMGAAFATVLAQLFAAAVVVVRLEKGVGCLRVREKDWTISGEITMRLIRVGIPSTGQMLSRSLMAFALMKIVSACGTAAQAAFGIVVRFDMILLMPAFALGNATAAMVGQNLGACKPDRAARAAWTAAGLGMFIMAVAALLMFVFAPQLIWCFSRDSAEVIKIGTAYLRTASPFLVAGAAAIVLGRALQGAGDAMPPMIITIVSLWCVQVPLAMYWSRIWQPPTQGIWWANAVTALSHGILTTAWFQSGRWKRKTV